MVSWPVVAGKGLFRCFRVQQTGPNSGTTHHLMCAGIELYGELWEMPE